MKKTTTRAGAMRNLATRDSRAFWAGVKRDAAAVRRLPAWKRAGVSGVHSSLPYAPGAPDQVSGRNAPDEDLDT